MIPLTLPATAEALEPFVVRLANKATNDISDARLVSSDRAEAVFSGEHGLFSVGIDDPNILAGDVLLVNPAGGAAERLIRANSEHNTLLATERCDQLCVMCSQPPKKTHVDRFTYFEEACLLAPKGMLIGISGGEPTLYKQELFGLVERTLEARPDLSFHILSNGQHFQAGDIQRLREDCWRKVVWGIPLYAPHATLHDEIVGKSGAHKRLLTSMGFLVSAGVRIELRTVLLSSNVAVLPAIAKFISVRVPFIESWSIMQLENIGFARNRWANLYCNHMAHFGHIGEAIDQARLGALNVSLFNFPRCTIPEAYRTLAPPSISDWKRKYPTACSDCSAKADCSGFFEWHPAEGLMQEVRPL